MAPPTRRLLTSTTGLTFATATELYEIRTLFGVMFQDGQLFPHRDVAGNVGYGIEHLPRAERAARIRELIEADHRSPCPGRGAGGREPRRACPPDCLTVSLEKTARP